MLFRILALIVLLALGYFVWTYSPLKLTHADTLSLPTPWKTTDVGSVSKAGSVTFSNNTFSIKGSGNDINDKADEFQFAYLQLTGNTTIVARVNSIQNTNKEAKAGIMIRESLQKTSKNVFLGVTSGSGIYFQKRTSNNASTTINKISGTAPYFLKLEKVNNDINAYKSLNGTSWEKIGSTSPGINKDFYIGLAVTSHNDGTLAIASFDSVSINGKLVAQSIPSSSPSASRPPSPSPSPSLTPSPTPLPSSQATPRAFPDTSNGIFIFNDQISYYATEPQFKFAASHYVGSQKMTLDILHKIRAYNPNFIHLHYRLSQQLGYKIPDKTTCNPTGPLIDIVNGFDWVHEWPGDDVVQDSWFYKWQNQRVYNCDWGHYLMDLDNTAWRQWWSDQVITQMQNNEADGLFADSFAIPNYFGSDRWMPNLPVLDDTFEKAWAVKEKNFTDYIRSRFAGRFYWIPNVTNYITWRDPSDYSGVDGAFFEGFSEYGWGRYYLFSDWNLQHNRLLALAQKNKIIILQSYPNASDINERMFILSNYLLIKGSKTYLNMEAGNVEWFPEYQINLGASSQALPSQISSLKDSSGLYKRSYQNGVVYVNSDTSSKTVNLGKTLYQATPVGGGQITDAGEIPSDWKINYTPITSLTLPPNQGAILLNNPG